MCVAGSLIDVPSLLTPLRSAVAFISLMGGVNSFHSIDGASSLYTGGKLIAEAARVGPCRAVVMANVEQEFPTLTAVRANNGTARFRTGAAVIVHGRGSKPWHILVSECAWGRHAVVGSCF